MIEPTPFEVHVPPAAVDDLRRRLRATRWPDRETVDDWRQGAPLAHVQALAEWWATEYDMGLADRVNAFPQVRVELDGLGIHLLHVRSPEPGALPLVLTHGWPGSVVEFLDVLGPLTDPVAHGGDAADAFHVVAPSLPGYGWSDKPTAAGWGVERIARAWHDLMTGLGYDRYVAQGGDWGAAVTTIMGNQAPDGLLGIHVNMPFAFPGADDLADLTPTEAEALADMAAHAETGMGYSSIQSTKPQTLGYGLADSPVGQLAWIIEKFHAWTDGGGRPEGALDRRHLLDNVSAYWFTGTAASSARLYWESFTRLQAETRVEIPSAATIFPREILRPSRRWAERVFTDLRHFEEVEAGGHFAAFEQPGIFVDQLRRAFREHR